MTMFENDNPIMPRSDDGGGGGEGTTIPTVGIRPSNLNYESSNYNKFAKGQCTWHCYGRAREAAGKTITFSQEYDNDAGRWYSRITNATRKSTFAAAAHSIAVWSGHVAYVEAVSGNDIYFTEANYRPDHVLSSDDGVVKVKSKANFEKHCSGFIGYVHLK